MELTRERLKALIHKFHNLGPAGLEGNVHPFFGPLTGKQWDETQYKYVDHPLRQFGVDGHQRSASNIRQSDKFTIILRV